MTGADATLQDLIAKLRAFPKAEMIGALSEIAQSELARGFVESTSPTGETWAPKKSGTGQPLIRTGALKASFRTQQSADGFELLSSVDYGDYHQEGTSRMPKRQIVPDGDLGTWESPMTAAADAVLQEAFGA